MTGALAVFAIATYFLTNSLSTTLSETLICAVLLQIGYFIGILFLVWKERRTSSHPRHAPSASKQFLWQPTRMPTVHLGDDVPAPIQARDDDKSAGLPPAGLNPPDPFKH
jgi:exopolysaccharide production repressor protein